MKHVATGRHRIGVVTCVEEMLRPTRESEKSSHVKGFVRTVGEIEVLRTAPVGVSFLPAMEYCWLVISKFVELCH